MRQHLFLTIFALQACAQKPPQPDPEQDVQLKKFASCSAMQNYIVDATVEQLVREVASMNGNDIAVLAVDEASGDASGEPSSYSETNVQEKGVDEPDMVKTNGTHIFVVEYNELLIVKSWPVESAEVVGRIALEGEPESLFLHGDKAVVFTQTWDDSWPSAEYGRTSLEMRIIDVSQPESPQLVRTVTTDGSFVAARLIEGQMYVTVSRIHSIPDAIWEMAWEEAPSSVNLEVATFLGREDNLRARTRNRLRPKVRAAWRAVDVAERLPQIKDDSDEAAPALDCTDIYHGAEETSPDVLSVIHIDLDAGVAGSKATATGVMAAGTVAYASTDHLYIGQGSVSWWDGWSAVERNTRIHRFDLEGSSTTYTGTGVVPGWLHNQFSMSEYGGFLRVATTDNDWWWGTETQDRRDGNNVYILDPEGGQMEIIGAVEGLAPGEQIYAARFLGEKGYLVTFVQVDPLFTLDLSDPTNPTVEGELKIPGYSAYLHPIENDHLLGVGMDGTDDGWLTGVSVSLFDVSEPAEPTQVDRLTVDSDWSDTEALWDHHAITVYDGVLTVPVYQWDDENYSTSSSLLVVDVDTTGLSEITRIDHADIVQATVCGDADDCDDFETYTEMRRGLFIEDYLFSISDYGIKITDMAAPDVAVATVPFWID